MRTIQLLTIIVNIIFLQACSGTTTKEEKPAITVSILPQKYMVERIAGDNFRVNVLVPPGSSAETFEPTARQMQDVVNSELYFGIGFMEFEGTLIRDLQRQNSGLNFVNTAEGVDLIAAEIVDHGDHAHYYGVDPHIWVSIPEVKIQLANMLGAITGLDPAGKDYYLDNYNRFLDELDELHLSFTGKFGEVKRRKFLIFHPALGYFARDYGLEQISIEQEGKNPTASNMKNIIDTAREEGIRDVFIQMEFELDNARAIARELGGDVIEINPLSENWFENMTIIAGKLHEVLNKD